jgi:hypothetical protein
MNYYQADSFSRQRHTAEGFGGGKRIFDFRAAKRPKGHKS